MQFVKKLTYWEDLDDWIVYAETNVRHRSKFSKDYLTKMNRTTLSLSFSLSLSHLKLFEYTLLHCFYIAKG